MTTDLRQSTQHAQYLSQISWIIEKIDGIFVFIRKIPLTPFSIIKIQHPEKLPHFKKIDQLAKKYRALSVYIEPSAASRQPSVVRLEKHGYKLSKSPYLPTKTIQLDLIQSKKKLFAQMEKDARYSLRKSHSKTLVYRTAKKDQKIKKFYQVWKKTAGWQRIIPSFKNILALKKSFGQNALFLAATQNREIVAGTIILIAGPIAYYYYAFTSKEGRQLLAQYGLVWEAIKKAKKRGCRIFDFEGIFDPRFPQKSWQGFTHFKKSFGGKELAYPGCFSRGLFAGRL